MGLKNIFSNSFETQDRGIDNVLITHYYDNDYEKAKQAVIDTAVLFGFRVQNVDDNYKEMLIIYPKGEIIVTLFNQSYYVTGIDFKVTTSYILAFGRGRKVIENFYNELGTKLNLKRIGGFNG